MDSSCDRGSEDRTFQVKISLSSTGLLVDAGSAVAGAPENLSGITSLLTLPFLLSFRVETGILIV